MVRRLAEQVAATWHLPDRGMWETRDAERHYLSSKVQCWMALDRAVRFGARLGERADLRRWAAIRDEIRATVLREGWNERVGAYTGAFGSAELDASVLRHAAGAASCRRTDPRMRSTIDVVERRAGPATGCCAAGTATRRVRALLVLAGGVPGDGGRAGPGRGAVRAARRARQRPGPVRRADRPGTGEQLGNFPQAFSHIGLINAAWRLTEPESY